MLTGSPDVCTLTPVFGLFCEEVQAEPGPADEHADSASSGAHDSGDDLSEGRNPWATCARSDLGADQPRENDREAEHGDVVRAHRSTRNAPSAIQPISAAVRPSEVASKGSVSVLIVGCA